MRWEYVDRSHNAYHHLWTCNPDGTGQMVYYGNMIGMGAFLDAKPIPNTDKVVFIKSPGHGRMGHQGDLCIIDPDKGPNNREGEKTILTWKGEKGEG